MIPAAFFFFQKPAVVQKETKVVNTPPQQTKPLPLSPSMASESREPAREEQDRAPVDLKLEKKPNRNQHREWESVVEIDQGMKILKDVFAVKTENYSPSMGESVAENGNFTMVNAGARPEGASPVAYDQANGRYYAVSSIVKVLGVSSEMRNDLLAGGFSEYYYAANINVLYVESSPEKVVDLYSDLKKQNLSAELEIIRPARIPR